MTEGATKAGGDGRRERKKLAGRELIGKGRGQETEKREAGKEGLKGKAARLPLASANRFEIRSTLSLPPMAAWPRTQRSWTEIAEEVAM